MAARLLHSPPPLAAREPIQRAGGDLHLPVGCGQRRYLQNTKKKATSKSVLILFSNQLLLLPLFRSAALSLPSNLPNLEPGIARAANRPGVWMAGSATSLILLHFYTGGVVHRCHGWETDTHEVSVFCPLLLSFGLPSHLLIVPVMSCWTRDAAVGRLMVVAGGDAEAEISRLTIRAALLPLMVKTG